jgi:putative phage-type endonuclease
MSSTVFDERKEWLESRKLGIGGTDISAVLNLNPWKNALDVFLGKTGKVEQQEPTEAMFWGSRLEPIILERYAVVSGFKVAPSAYVADLYPHRSMAWNGQTLVEHAELPWALGTPDGIAYEMRRGVEIKNIGFKNSDWGKPGTDEIPHHYRLQCAWYMAIAELDTWDLAALFSGNRLEIFTIARDRELEDLCLNAGADFWHNNVLKQLAPPVDGSESWKRHLSNIYAVGNQTMIETTPEIEVAAEALRFAQMQIEAAQGDERAAKIQLAALLGENKGARLNDGGSAQWVRPKAGTEVDWEAVAKALAPPAEIIKEHTREVKRSAYVRLYEGKRKK